MDIIVIHTYTHMDTIIQADRQTNRVTHRQPNTHRDLRMREIEMRRLRCMRVKQALAILRLGESKIRLTEYPVLCSSNYIVYSRSIRNVNF